jgi:hypothetical protein
MHSSAPLRFIFGPPFSQSLLFVMTLSINRLLPRFGLELNHQDATSNLNGDRRDAGPPSEIFRDEWTD